MLPLYDLLEMFTGDFRSAEVFVQVNQDGSEHTEKSTETEDNAISDGFIQRWAATKESILTSVRLERRDVNGRHVY
jgi:hypothetical protein